jgi:hypothetical protein
LIGVKGSPGWASNAADKSKNRVVSNGVFIPFSGQLSFLNG